MRSCQYVVVSTVAAGFSENAVPVLYNEKDEQRSRPQ
jgi:hypothetical protein